MARRRMIYEGQAKILYEGPEPVTIVMSTLAIAGLGRYVRRRTIARR